MRGTKAKALRKYCNLQQLPRPIYRKIKKTHKMYNLSLTQTLHLIDITAQKWNKALNDFKKGDT